MDLGHEKRLADVENRSKSNQHRLDKVEQKQDELFVLANSIKLIAEREEHLEENVNEIKNDVKELKNKPAERWNSLMDKIIVTIAAAIVGFILAKFGL